VYIKQTPADLLQTLLGLMRMVLQNSTNYMRDKYGFTANATEDENNSGQTHVSAIF
jgi:hypothetical protein